MSQVKDRPLVSVVLPVFNGEKYIGETLESIEAQTYRPMELIVVDDGSTDDTMKIVDAFSLQKTVIRQENKGVGDARNVAIRAARGKYIAFNDYDDLWMRDKTSKQVDLFESEKDIDVVYAGAMPFFDSGKKRFQKDKHELSLKLTDENAFALMAQKNLIPITAAMAEKESLIRAGLFDPTFRTCGDYEIWLRMAAMNMRFRYVPEVLTLGRKHAGNISGHCEIMHQNRVRAIRKTFANPELCPIKKKQEKNALANVYAMGAHTFFSANRYQDFWQNANRALVSDLRVITPKFISRYLRSFVFLSVSKLKTTSLF